MISIWFAVMQITVCTSLGSLTYQHKNQIAVSTIFQLTVTTEQMSAIHQYSLRKNIFKNVLLFKMKMEELVRGGVQVFQDLVHE